MTSADGGAQSANPGACLVPVTVFSAEMLAGYPSSRIADALHLTNESS